MNAISLLSDTSAHTNSSGVLVIAFIFISNQSKILGR